MDPAGDSLAGGEDVVEPHESIGGRHRPEYGSRVRSRGLADRSQGGCHGIDLNRLAYLRKS